jgi:hypothetical protein
MTVAAASTTKSSEASCHSQCRMTSGLGQTGTEDIAPGYMLPMTPNLLVKDQHLSHRTREPKTQPSDCGSGTVGVKFSSAISGPTRYMSSLQPTSISQGDMDVLQKARRDVHSHLLRLGHASVSAIPSIATPMPMMAKTASVERPGVLLGTLRLVWVGGKVSA